MRYKVKKEFTDDELGFVHSAGDVLDIDDDRYDQMKKNAELQNVELSNYVEVLKEDKKTKGAETSTK